MASMALLIKVHKQNCPGGEYVSQIDDPSYKICQELTRILNPLDEKGDLLIRDTSHFKVVQEEDLKGVMAEGNLESSFERGAAGCGG